MATRMKRCPSEAFGSIPPMTSIPYMENGHGVDNTFNVVGKTLILSTYFWHLRYFLILQQHLCFHSCLQHHIRSQWPTLRGWWFLGWTTSQRNKELIMNTMLHISHSYTNKLMIFMTPWTTSTSNLVHHASYYLLHFHNELFVCLLFLLLMFLFSSQLD